MGSNSLGLPQRFWDKVRLAGPDECWEWQGCRDRDGYGRINLVGRSSLAHRVVAEAMHGPLAGMVTRHGCDNPRCVNPRHLSPGTQAENLHDMTARGRRCRGENHGNAKLTEAAVRRIVGVYAGGGVSMRVIAQKFGVSHQLVSKIISGRNWKHVAPQEL